ncbi:MAG TPA: NAD(P)/FAD-dependent oxidoreductase [Alphaproteobacteria bacterium]|jgi:cation diffusion facilitator CzcD-associated flavoprotein CzcO|nr:NAD(P)/FAD-dependent oxidoreductase [Alphaproteobacteria bacterium]
MRVGIIGAGPGGICAGIRLKQSGYGDFTILEQAPGIGGTWWHNSYPGCACDVPSHLYSFSFATRQEWPRPYGNQPEVRAYLEDVVDSFGIRPYIRLNTKVESAAWQEDRSEWHVATATGESFPFDVLIGAVGLFNMPVTPDIPGLGLFAGTKFHSARWNHDHDLTGEAVAVIGSAASATQFIPKIAPLVGRLDVYQRTPNWVRPRDDAYTPGQQARFRGDPSAAAQERETIWGWIDAIVTLDDPVTLAESRAVCLKNLEAVDDPETRRKLTPDYPFGGKRPLISNDFYPTFNRPNVHLITDPIARITSDAVVAADGTARKIDTIVLATGFDTMRFLSAIPVTGKGGRRLQDAWAGGPEAYLGITVSGFPNLFMLYGPNTNNGSIIFQIECQVEYALRHIRRIKEQRLAWIDVKPDAMAVYNRTLQSALEAVEVWNTGTCRDYYRHPSGRIVTQWPHGMGRYRDVTGAADDAAYEVGAA